MGQGQGKQVSLSGPLILRSKKPTKMLRKKKKSQNQCVLLLQGKDGPTHHGVRNTLSSTLSVHTPLTYEEQIETDTWPGGQSSLKLSSPKAGLGCHTVLTEARRAQGTHNPRLGCALSLQVQVIRPQPGHQQASVSPAGVR